MYLPSFFYWACLVLFGQDITASSVRIPLGDMNPEVVLRILQGQLGAQSPITLEEHFLVVGGDPALLEAVRGSLSNLGLGTHNPADLLPAPAAELALAVDGAPRSLMNLVDDYVQQVSFTCFVSQELRARLEQTPLELSGVAAIGPAQAVHHLETLLALSRVNIALSVVDGKTCMNLGDMMRPQSSIIVPFVAERSLYQYAIHPAIRICTAVELSHTDVRSLSNTVRQLIVDPPQQQIFPAGSSNVLVISGPGEWVFQLAQMLRMTDTLQAIQQSQEASRRAPVLEVFVLKSAHGEELLEIVAGFLGVQSGSDPLGPASRKPYAEYPIEADTKVLFDPRTNSLIVWCKAEQMTDVQVLVAKLDVEQK